MPTGSQYLAKGLDPKTGLPPLAGTNQSSSSTYFPQKSLLPPYLQQLVDALGGNAQGAAGQYNDYISNPTASPLFQNTLNGLLAALAPSEAQARQSYNDQGVQAGNRSSGAFATGGAKLEGDLMRNRQTTASQVLAQQFPQMVSALMQPQQLAAQLMQALKLSQGFGANPGGGTVAGGVAGGGNPEADFLARYHANGAGNPYDPFNPSTFSPSPFATTQAAPAPVSDPYAYGSGGTLFTPNGDYISGGNNQGGPAPWSPPEYNQPGAGGGSSSYSDFRQPYEGEFNAIPQNGALEY